MKRKVLALLLGIVIGVTAVPQVANAEVIESVSNISMVITDSDESSAAEVAEVFSVDSKRSVTSIENEMIIYKYLKNEMGLNTAAACGILANIYHESTFNPNAGGDNGMSYGICQWYNTRKTALINWCDENGYDYKTLDGQLNYLKYELVDGGLSGGKVIYNSLANVENTAEGAYDAAYTFCYKYEVPANTKVQAEKRGNLAKDTYWPCYSGKTESSLFTDVSSDDWYYEYVNYVTENDLMIGTSDTTFGADEILSRAQFAVILHRMNGKPVVNYKNQFPDVENSTWYTDAALWASSTGIIKGYNTGYFGTNDSITREQMALMMCRYAEYMKYDVSGEVSLNKFTDANSVSDYALTAMQWAVGNGIINGKGDGSILDPQGSASRAECAAIIMRFVEKYK